MVSGEVRSLGFRPLFFGGSSSPSRSVSFDLVHGFALLSNVDKRHTDGQAVKFTFKDFKQGDIFPPEMLRR